MKRQSSKRIYLSLLLTSIAWTGTWMDC